MDGTGGTAGIRMQVPAGQFLCAGAVLESPRLAKGSPVDAKSPMLSRDAPKTSQWRHKCPKVCPKTAQGAPKRPQRFPREKQKERNAVLYTPKPPINRTSGHYVNNCKIDLQGETPVNWFWTKEKGIDGGVHIISILRLIYREQPSRLFRGSERTPINNKQK